ncbi:YadA-like family protein [Sphingomonas sp. LY160]|uniref:YadA-like family protein n=1 Tax=Sphingomonas sp. LY160 TaxID=3095342 RepID=UPI002ADEE605|nr:YadA-like family protein [Sphingomonas sp. LY160]MEA1072975.1 YadA-like family protein [Sphingomonas sp. LY160]
MTKSSNAAGATSGAKMPGKATKPILLILSAFVAVPSAQGQTLTFTGTRENVNPVAPPGGRCVPPYFSTVNIAPGALSSTGTSNISTFTSTQSHCINSAPPTSLIDGQFTYAFEGGDTIFGTYTGDVSAIGTTGTFNAVENLVITGGTGRFVGASGSINSDGTLRFTNGNGVFEGTLSGSIVAPTTTMSGSFATALGVPSAATGDYSTAIGAFSFAPGARSTAVGTFAEASGPSSVALGDNTFASGDRSVAIGRGARATNVVTVAIGNVALASGLNATAVGNVAQATGMGASAFGNGAVATAAGTFAGGVRSTASGTNSTAVGALSTASAELSTAIGRQSTASGMGATALGGGASATAAGAVAIGQNSLAAEANTVSVGIAGGERRIVNVANGTGATDAVNLSQLTATNASLATETSSRMAADAALSGLIDDLSFDIRHTAREARAGTAAALAAAGLPQASGEGRTMIAGGVGTYRGRTALAIGASHRLQGGQAIFKVGVTYDSSKHTGANAGFGIEF